MSFPRYPKYKSSGVEWLGEVPEHWTISKLKQFCAFSGGGTPDRENLAFWNGDIPWVSPKDMKTEQIVGAEESITEKGLKSSAASLIPPGRVLLVVRSGILKHTIPVAINETTVALNQDMKALHLDDGRCLNSYFFRWVQGLNDPLLLVWAKQGATVESIEHSYLCNTMIPLPPLAEQTCIAKFLERETGKIDELVAEQQRLMELLKEKRQAVISHAVTKGLNPRAPMKPSGIEWLGDVPEHWEVAPVSSRYSVQLGKMLDSDKITGEHLRPYLRVFDVQWGEINTDELPLMDFDEDARTKFRLLPGDLLVNEGGSYPGRSAIWSGKIDECYYQKALHRLRQIGKERDTTRFLYYVMSWAANQGVFVAGGNETTIEHLPAEKLRRYRFTFPPMKEQLAIADFLDSELTKLDALTAETQKAINLLQERRTALISAAVTGQIDVRKLAAA
jgi:type I restriction enzyme S subunit